MNKNTKYPIAIDASAMHDINRSAILDIIRRESPISRTAIAELLDVSIPTVMRIVDELVNEGLVKLQGATEWSGGRRRPLLEFNAAESIVIGVDLGGTTFYGAISDLGGNILEEVELSRSGSSAEENFLRTSALIDQLLASPKLNDRKIRGIGVGVPGVVEYKTGSVTWAYSLNWRNYALRNQLTEKYHLPMIVDNDMNLAALGELWFGRGQEIQNMILLTITTGIGSGIIIDRELYRGSTNSSGEIGDLLPGKDFLGRSYQDFGALESIASVTGMLRQARDKLALSPQQPLDLEDIFSAYQKGQPWANQVIADVVQYLAVAIANLSVTFDPDLIVLGGDVTRLSNQWIDWILEAIGKSIPNPPRLVMSNLGRKAVVLGTIIDVLHYTSNFYVVRKLI